VSQSHFDSLVIHQPSRQQPHHNATLHYNETHSASSTHNSRKHCR
jgi:hypothetical protein